MRFPFLTTYYVRNCSGSALGTHWAMDPATMIWWCTSGMSSILQLWLSMGGCLTFNPYVTYTGFQQQQKTTISTWVDWNNKTSSITYTYTDAQEFGCGCDVFGINCTYNHIINIYDLILTWCIYINNNLRYRFRHRHCILYLFCLLLTLTHMLQELFLFPKVYLFNR